jgi:hypothetical protein
MSTFDEKIATAKQALIEAGPKERTKLADQIATLEADRDRAGRTAAILAEADRANEAAAKKQEGEAMLRVKAQAVKEAKATLADYQARRAELQAQIAAIPEADAWYAVENAVAVVSDFERNPAAYGLTFTDVLAIRLEYYE